jgi:hypothetical protein
VRASKAAVGFVSLLFAAGPPEAFWMLLSVLSCISLVVSLVVITVFVVLIVLV